MSTILTYPNVTIYHHMFIYISKKLTHVQLCNYAKSQQQCYNLIITIYHVNLVLLVQNTYKLYKNIFHNMRSKTPQTISHNHIRIILIQLTSKNKSKFGHLRILTHVYSNPNCDKFIPYL